MMKRGEKKPGLKEAWGGKQGPGFVMLHSFTYGCFVGEISLHQEGYWYALSFYCVPGSVRGTSPHGVSHNDHNTAAKQES